MVLSAVQAGHAGEAVHFLRNTQLFLPSHNVILYDLGLGSHELTLVQHYCNTSLCSLKKFDPALFPGHVRNYRTNAFRFEITVSSLFIAFCKSHHAIAVYNCSPFYGTHVGTTVYCHYCHPSWQAL